MGRISQVIEYDDMPTAPLQAQRAGRPRRLRPQTVTMLICLALLLVNVLGYGAVWGYNAYRIEKTARADLNLRITRLQALAANGKALTPAGMRDMRVELTGVDHDLRQLEGLLPLQNENIGPEATLIHGLRLGIDLVDAALAGLNAEQALAPALQALLYSATHADLRTLPAGAHPLTSAEITVAQQALATIALDWAKAQSERAYISPSALQSLGGPRMAKALAEYDKYAPNVPLGLAMAQALVDWSPAMLGLLRPFHMLLFDMDSDELRATGGFLGNYSELTMAQGLLTSGVHLHDIYTLDCPNQICPDHHPVPSQYAWFTTGGDKFGVRDSNLDPSFPSSAGEIISLYTQRTGDRIDAVFAMTPTLIHDMLEVTGPISVPQYHVTVNADNLNATIHYFHQNPQITAQLGIDYGSLGTSVFKAFDVLLSHALMARISTLSGGQEAKLGSALLKAFATKDVQIFASNLRVEALLEQIGAAGQVESPNYDNLMVVDTNDGASYANSDIQEHVTDTIALDSAGGATHTLTITYAFPNVSHLFAQQDFYGDFIRVIVGTSTSTMTVTGPCDTAPTVQAYHYVLGCQMRLLQGKSLTVTFSWRVPHAFSPGKQGSYRLLLQRQAGSRVSMQVIVKPPTGATLTTTSAGMRAEHGDITWSASQFLSNTTLTVGVS